MIAKYLQTDRERKLQAIEIMKRAARVLREAAKALDGMEFTDAVSGMADEADHIAERLKHY